MSEWDLLSIDDDRLRLLCDNLTVCSISIKNSKAIIAWEEVAEGRGPAGGTYGRSVNGVEDFHLDMYQLYKDIGNCVPEILYMVMEGDDYNFVDITNISFKVKDGALQVKLSAKVSINGSSAIGVYLPFMKLYQFGDNDENQKKKIFTKNASNTLSKLELEAKYYILGKRRPEDGNLFNRDEE